MARVLSMSIDGVGIYLIHSHYEAGYNAMWTEFPPLKRYKRSFPDVMSQGIYSKANVFMSDEKSRGHDTTVNKR